jgi:hypothetical protein
VGQDEAARRGVAVASSDHAGRRDGQVEVKECQVPELGVLLQCRRRLLLQRRTEAAGTADAAGTAASRRLYGLLWARVATRGHRPGA